MATIALTIRQKSIFDFYVNYHTKHGVFPNPTQAATALGWSVPSVNSYLGALFLKGAFTGGTPMTSTYRRLSGVDVKAFNVNGKSFDATPLRPQTRQTRQQNNTLPATPARSNRQSALSSQDLADAFKKFIEQNYA